ncbi:MAG: hypothetical protein AAF674_15680 [Pseudomonadota bacterium]
MYNRRAIMQRAWEIYRRARRISAAAGEDGIHLPHRVLLRNALLAAWSDAKFERKVANLPPQPTSGPAAELARLNAKSFWSREDYQMADELRRAA